MSNVPHKLTGTQFQQNPSYNLRLNLYVPAVTTVMET